MLHKDNFHLVEVNICYVTARTRLGIHAILSTLLCISMTSLSSVPSSMMLWNEASVQSLSQLWLTGQVPGVHYLILVSNLRVLSSFSSFSSLYRILSSSVPSSMPCGQACIQWRSGCRVFLSIPWSFYCIKLKCWSGWAWCWWWCLCLWAIAGATRVARSNFIFNGIEMK